MKDGRHFQAALFFALVALFGTTAQAAGESPSRPCQLQRVASLDMETLPSGKVAIPVSLNDRQSMFEIDTGSIYSSITSEAASELGLQEKAAGRGQIFMNGVGNGTFAYLNSFSLGPLRSKERVPLLTSPSQLVPASVSGLLGSDVMSAYDVELDFFHGKFNLFLHKSCASAVYWTRDAYASPAMKLDRGHHVIVDALLDGKPVTVLLDTGAPGSVMSLEAARDLFGWSKDDSRIALLKTKTLNGGTDTPFFSFPFSALAFDGVTVENPKIQLIPQENFDRHGRGDAQIILGTSVLRQLHLYLAYDERRLYLTPAEAH